MRASRTAVVAVALAAAAGVTFASVRIADACGCVSPPAVTEGDYAVNQQSEMIIFEVEQNWVTAHVLIKYAGDPEQFAWIVPVPEAPELGLSPVSAFGLLAGLTAPDTAVTLENMCPISEWACHFHDTPSCGGGGGGCGMGAAGGDDDDVAAPQDAASAQDASGGGPGDPPVEVISEEVVGDYQTVTFRASEAGLAAEWLRDNGFIVNDTTTLYMESYVEANMVFVAVKLVPGAGVAAIKPLRMRFRAPFPMIPLVLTAVAAEPHLTVTAFVYGDTAFRPMSHPVVAIDPARIAQNRAGRNNYPMVLARTIDEAGGDAFAVEYQATSPLPQFGGPSGCCNDTFDFCSISNNDQCECPRSEFDRLDCEAAGDVIEGVALLDRLFMDHPRLTRITTRMSPEEMRFDPTFEPGIAGTVGADGRLVARGAQPSLLGCVQSVMDQDDFVAIDGRQECAAVYCGTGQCMVTAAGGGCACDAGTVARQFTDLDGAKSVTCIPAEPPVDLEAGGIDLPDACIGVDCGMGTCNDRNGVAVCTCNGGAAAVTVDAQRGPRCVPIVALTGTPGAEDFSEPLRTLPVCAPPPPSCGANGWLERDGSARPGVDCGNATPSEAQQTPPPMPTCPDGSNGGMYGCGCQGTHPAGALLLAWITAFLLFRKRRASR